MSFGQNKKQILKSYIENISCIANKEYQERIWVRSEGTEYDDIDDTICDFFDDDYVLKNYKEFGITETQYELIMNLYRTLRDFADKYNVYSFENSTESLINLPEWEKIMEMAKEVLKAFDYKQAS